MSTAAVLCQMRLAGHLRGCGINHFHQSTSSCSSSQSSRQVQPRAGTTHTQSHSAQPFVLIRGRAGGRTLLLLLLLGGLEALGWRLVYCCCSCCCWWWCLLGLAAWLLLLLWLLGIFVLLLLLLLCVAFLLFALLEGGTLESTLYLQQQWKQQQ